MWRNLVSWLDEAFYPMVRVIELRRPVAAATPVVPEQHGSPAYRLARWNTYEVDVNDRYQHEVTDYIVRDGLLYFTRPLAADTQVTIFKT